MANSNNINRRHFLKTAAITSTALLLNNGCSSGSANGNKQLFDISLAQWSLHEMLYAKKLTNLEFPSYTKMNFNLSAIEYVSRFFEGNETNNTYLTELKKRCQDSGVQSLLIMVDHEGYLAAKNDSVRKESVNKHKKWVAAARFLGCHSIRVNAKYGDKSAAKEGYSETMKQAADGLNQLGEHAEKSNISILVENHGGLSSNGKWLSGVMKLANRNNVGTLPDFGNFYEYDRYQGVKDLMPYAKGVSAKSYAFDNEGNETTVNYRKMLNIVTTAGYHNHIGIEYERKKGSTQVPEMEGIRKTQALLEKIRMEMK